MLLLVPRRTEKKRGFWAIFSVLGGLRSQSFEIEPHIIRKEDHPWNGYVDAVAFCWSSPNGKIILNESGWEGSCLIGASPYFLRHCIDTMEHEDVISPDDWAELLKIAPGRRRAARQKARFYPRRTQLIFG